MNFSAYLAKISFTFSKVPQNCTALNLSWSNAGLQIIPPSCLQLIHPQSNTTLFLPISATNSVLQFFDLSENQSVSGTLNIHFSNADSLENVDIDLLFCDFLSGLNIVYLPIQDQETGQWFLAVHLAWQINPLLLNTIASYTLQSKDINNNQLQSLRNDETAYSIAPLQSGESLQICLSALHFNGERLGSVAFTLYIPTLKPRPQSSQASNIGYSKQMDSSGIQESYQVNHDKTLGQMTEPVQIHSAETRSLSQPLTLMNPTTVISGTAREYVNTFDPEVYNAPFDYTDAKTGAVQTASQTTAQLNQQHEGNYTLNHQGTFNQNTNINDCTQTLQAPQINQNMQNVQGIYSGETFSKVAQNEYEQIENEQNFIESHALQAPSFQENTNNLTQQVDNLNLQSQNMTATGNQLNLNGIVSVNGPCDLGFGSGSSPAGFTQPNRVPNNPYPTIPSASDDYYQFLATVYGEGASVPAAWEAVADSIVLRAVQNNQTPGKIVAARQQYDAYINPSSINFDNVEFSTSNIRGHIQFIKAYAYLTKKTLNKNTPMTLQESKTLAAMDQQIRPIYALYTNKNVLLKPIIISSSPDQNDTCTQAYKQNNPANPLKYYITNYYSPQGQGDASVGFLGNIPTNINPDQYEVVMPGVMQNQFKFYNIPYQYH